MTERGASPDEMLFYRIVPAIPASALNLHLRGLRHKAVAGRVRSGSGTARPLARGRRTCQARKGRTRGQEAVRAVQLPIFSAYTGSTEKTLRTHCPHFSMTCASAGGVFAQEGPWRLYSR